MSQYNVTRDIRKLAEEAERNKTQDMTLAGLGLGGGFVASQTGGSATNQRRPSNITIQANEAQARANQANANKQFRNLGNLNTSTQVNIPDPKIEKNPFPKPTFTTEPKLDTRPGTGGSFSYETDPLKNQSKRTPRVRPEPTGFRGNLIKTAEGTADFAKNVGQNLKKIGPKLGPLGAFGVGQLVEEYTGLDEAIAGAVNIDQGMQDYFSEVGRDPSRRTGLHKIGDTVYDAFNFATKATGDLFELPFQAVGAGYDALMKQPGEVNINPFTRTFRGETYQEFSDGVSPSGAGMYARRPNPEMSSESVAKNFETGDVKSMEDVLPESPAIPLSDRSELEKQIIRNQQAGQPLLAGTFENQQMNQAFGGEGVPTYQANFLERKQQEEPITDAEFQKAQQFALKRGMVFDPETGYSKADFFGQMFKGQTIGQFLRGEDAPEGFTDVVPQFQVGLSPEESRKAYEQASKEREERLANRPDFGEAVPDKPKGEMTLGDYRNLARAEGFKGSAQIAEAKRLMREDQRKDELTPYQKETLARSDRSADLAERKFQESIRQYKEGVEKGQEADQLANMYKKVQILGLLNNLTPEQDELGFDLEPDVINDYVGVLEEFGVEYDPETQIYKRKGKFGFGKQLSKEELAELSPLLEETKFIKLLEYTSKNNQ